MTSELAPTVSVPLPEKQPLVAMMCQWVQIVENRQRCERRWLHRERHHIWEPLAFIRCSKLSVRIDAIWPKAF